MSRGWMYQLLYLIDEQYLKALVYLLLLFFFHEFRFSL